MSSIPAMTVSLSRTSAAAASDNSAINDNTAGAASASASLYTALPAWPFAEAPGGTDDRLLFLLDRMRDDAVPLRLRLVTFLRVTAALFHSGSGSLCSGTTAGLSIPRYSDILARLASHDARWWERCQLNEEGLPVSGDCWIDEQLQPFIMFVGCIKAASL